MNTELAVLSQLIDIALCSLRVFKILGFDFRKMGTATGCVCLHCTWQPSFFMGSHRKRFNTIVVCFFAVFVEVNTKSEVFLETIVVEQLHIGIKCVVQLEPRDRISTHLMQ